MIADTQLYALDPTMMATAQNSMIEFVLNKLGQAKGELAEADRIFDSLTKAKMSVIPAQRIMRRARLRIAFYEKVQAALKAGYYILPPIPCQAFAIRTNRVLPNANTQVTNGWSGDPDVKRVTLPLGEGTYRNSKAVREQVDTQVKTGTDGKTTSMAVWENTDWKEIEFPFMPVLPEIIEKTAAAMKLKIFDVLAVAPQYRRPDPMVIGCIKHWKQGAGDLNFFVAWWLDTDTL